MRAAIYVRVSTDLQTTDLQLRDLEAYAKARSWEYEIFQDLGISGTKSKRPALDRLLDACRKRKFDVVMVWRFDRFARSSQFLISALEEFKGLGIQFISFQENLDTSSAMGMAMFTIISAMAQLERDIIRERVKAGMATAKAKGKRMGRPGMITPELKGLAIGYSLAGESYQKIADKLKVSKALVAKMLKL